MRASEAFPKFYKYILKIMIYLDHVPSKVNVKGNILFLNNFYPTHQNSKCQIHFHYILFKVDLQFQEFVCIVYHVINLAFIDHGHFLVGIGFIWAYTWKWLVKVLAYLSTLFQCIYDNKCFLWFSYFNLQKRAEW